MAVYLVTWDNPLQDYTRLQAFVKAYDAMRFTDSAYAIAAEQDAEALYAALRPSMAQDDVAYVVRLDAPWIGYGYEAMNDWLKRHL